MRITKTNLNKTNDDSQLASLMYEQAIKHIEAIEYEIQEIEFNGCKLYEYAVN
jgi:hypothetical protein